MAVAARNWLAVWDHERVGIPVGAATDEIALALTADALARTYRTTPVAIAESATPLRLQHGIVLVPDATAGAASVDRTESLPGPEVSAAAALDRALLSIEARYGAATADFVALQLEYPERRLRTTDTATGRIGDVDRLGP